MKTKLLAFLPVLLLATATFGQTKAKAKVGMDEPTYTKLLVKNDKSTPVDVYITFAAQNSANNCCAMPAGVADFKFLTPVHKLMGKFKLAAKSSQLLDPKGKCFSGNVCFYIEPQCPVKGADFDHGKKGTSIFEFTLNPSTSCGETIDISCVNGVNSFLTVNTNANSGWTYGANVPIDSFYNKDLQKNAGLPGVYPVNCTTCIASPNPPCSTLPIGPAQTQQICNVQRSSRGGLVRVTLQNKQP